MITAPFSAVIKTQEATSVLRLFLLAMLVRTHRLKLTLIVLAACLFAASPFFQAIAGSPEDSFAAPEGYAMPYGKNPFAPSNAKTTTNQLISQAEFIPAARCASCHEATHAEWSESAHRNAFREPFYQANVKQLIDERSIEVTRHCESCHNPVALFSGALTKNAKMERPFDDEGISCSVCHSIQSTTTEGIGSYTIAPPALLVREDGTRIREASDAEIMDDLPAHSRAMMRPLLSKPEFCASCHKAAITPEFNGRKWFRTFSVYDEWQQSAFSNETVQPLNSRQYQSCQSCHMKPETGGYAGHRWPGGNTAIPAHYGWDKQLQATANLLKSDVVSVDIFALNTLPATQKAVTAPLDTKTIVAPGEQVAVDVVVANKGVGHAFPAELRDMFEAWLEFEAADAEGRVLVHSGAVSKDGTLEWDAHAYRSVPINDKGEPITAHDIWNTRVAGFDRHIPAGRADIGRFTFNVPHDARSPIKVTAKLNYRRFNSRFIEAVNRTEKVAQSPVVEMTVATTTLQVADKRGAVSVAGVPKDVEQRASLRKRWRLYGVALFDQQQYETAAHAFGQARDLAPQGSTDEAASCIDLAITYMRMERAGAPQAIIEQANKAIARAIEIDQTNGRARFYRALLAVKGFRYTEALADLEALAKERPRDRQVWSQLASLYLLQRRDREAQAAYEQVLKIDPDDTESHFKLGGLYWRFGLFDLAKNSQEAFQARHTDTVGETLRRDFLRRRPELYSTWTWREFGDNPIGSLP